MRKVMFKKWIPTIRVQIAGQHSPWVAKEGTGKWENDFTNEGLFHLWANAYEEFESGAGNYTVALVEIPTGEIVEVLPSNIIFIGV